MLVMTEESFGPLVGVMPFDRLEEAVNHSNDTPYGLASYLYTQDAAEIRHLSRRLDYGNVAVNNVDAGVMNAPYGGRKQSGVGQVNGETGLRGYCHPLPILIDRFGPKEEQVWYPYTADKERTLQKVIKWVWGTPLGRWISRPCTEWLS